MTADQPPREERADVDRGKTRTKGIRLSDKRRSVVGCGLVAVKRVEGAIHSQHCVVDRGWRERAGPIEPNVVPHRKGGVSNSENVRQRKRRCVGRVVGPEEPGDVVRSDVLIDLDAYRSFARRSRSARFDVVVAGLVGKSELGIEGLKFGRNRTERGLLDHVPKKWVSDDGAVHNPCGRGVIDFTAEHRPT